MAVLIETGEGASVQGLDVELYSLPLLALLPESDLVMVPPSREDVSGAELAHQSLSLVDQLSISLAPLCEELVKVSHLLGTPVVQGLQLLLLDVLVPFFEGLPARLEASIRLEVLLEELIHKLLAPHIDKPVLGLQVVQMKHADACLHSHLGEVGQVHLFAWSGKRLLAVFGLTARLSHGQSQSLGPSGARG